MTIEKISKREIKAQLRRIRRAKNAAIAPSKKKPPRQANRKKITDLQKIAGGLSESTTIEKQGERGDAEMEKEELRSQIDLLRGKQ
ncbi:hypothetical protein [Halobellus marinus]|uniref:hypothetical protein n=1 Tax=Halobellus TaxID=1073986 RepID=UPI0028A9B7E6|nr:hypothetical protein [Halobellus sp. DFY28]